MRGEPLKTADHPELEKELNNMSIAIKIHYLMEGDTENHKKVRENYSKPTWEEVEKLIMKALQVIHTEFRSDPRKY